MQSHTQTFAKLAEKILALKGNHAQKVIGVDGGSGAGKSTFAELLQQQLPAAHIIPIDGSIKVCRTKHLIMRHTL